MKYCYTRTTERPLPDAESAIREALKARGFGILTEIDAEKTIREKLGIETPPYKILGACNPRFAHQAMTEEPDIGVLLPCNILLRTEGERTVVSAILPTAQLGRVGNPALLPLAEQVEASLKAAVDDATRA